MNALLKQNAAPQSPDTDEAPGWALQVHDVTRHFPVSNGLLRSALGSAPRAVRAIDGVSFGIRRGET